MSLTVPPTRSRQHGCSPQSQDLPDVSSSLRGGFSLPLSQIACSGWGPQTCEVSARVLSRGYLTGTGSARVLSLLPPPSLPPTSPLSLPPPLPFPSPLHTRVHAAPVCVCVCVRCFVCSLLRSFLRMRMQDLCMCVRVPLVSPSLPPFPCLSLVSPLLSLSLTWLFSLCKVS